MSVCVRYVAKVVTVSLFSGNELNRQHVRFHSGYNLLDL